MRYLPLTFAFILSSCGVFKWWGEKAPKREVASTEIRGDINQQLLALHSYYVIGQAHLADFDQKINSASSLEELYESDSYLKLLAVRIYAEEIEHDLVIASQELNSQKSSQPGLDPALELKARILAFQKKTPMATLTLENLQYQLGMGPQSLLSFVKNEKSLQKELNTLKATKDFQVIEKNVEYLSHMLELEMEKTNKKFVPSAGKEGNIFGTEFPDKVWALTFDDGPGKATSPLVIKNLADRGLKATFFQLTKQVLTYPETAKLIRESGMEIASHSYTHQQLTKVGAATLDHEIKDAYEDLKKAHGGIDVKYFRLPYGAGVSNARIRQKIADLGLIHVFWSIDTLDWMAQTPDKIVDRALTLMKKSSKDSGIILFHDIHMRTTQASPLVMDYLKKDGRRVCTVGEIVSQMNEGTGTVCPKK